MAYEVGRHVPQNCAEASRWVTTAAEAGNAAAQYNLGLRYRDGDGVSANRGESEKWLRRAASRRYPKANLALKMLASR
jgi:TPR repeat protein